MPLEDYSKAELKKIVELYNISVDESSLKKKKKDLIKDMQGVKKNYNYTEIDKKLSKKETTTSEPKKKKLKLKVKDKESPVEKKKIKFKVKEQSEEKKKQSSGKYMGQVGETPTKA